MASSQVFVAFPAQPHELYECIQEAVGVANARNSGLQFRGWPDNDIAGRPLTGPILEGISTAAFVIADITFLNFNVTYEVGFAIGAGKRAYLVLNNCYEDSQTDVSQIGIFDTLGYEEYNNAESLASVMLNIHDHRPIDINYRPNFRAPVYLVETPSQGDVMRRIVSSIKKARLQYRSFSPSEEARLPAIEAIEHVANSHGIVIPMLQKEIRDSTIHNIRAAFVAGLAHGMEKPTLILQHQKETLPIDVRDFCKIYHRPRDVERHINAFALEVVGAMQEGTTEGRSETNLLSQLYIGDPMAENEFQTLSSYYLKTDEYFRSLRGEVNLVVGRKGSGKTALFGQVRDRLRRDRAKIVVDLKPEGYQLTKLKEAVLPYLKDGAKAHLLSAFWEYVLLIEVAYKLIEKDKHRHLRDHEIHLPYVRLKENYFKSPSAIQGDFSERLMELSSTLVDNFAEISDGASANSRLLTTDEITEIVHSGNLLELVNHLGGYLKYKKGVWILFDNLDKGWNLPTPSQDDIIILRSLLDAGRKIQKNMQRRNFDFYCIVFIRNDVYQLLMDESPDFGKEMRVSLDWSDSDLLREMMRLRLVHNRIYRDNDDFSKIWPELCISHIQTQESSQYLIDRCLMRPRNLLKIFCHCKGFAVNLRHSHIESEDIRKGLFSYSKDLVMEADQELSNIEPTAAGLIYHFSKEHWKFSKEEIFMLFEEFGLDHSRSEAVLKFFLYFGFLGIKIAEQTPIYIYDVGYDMKMLEADVQKHAKNLVYVLNPAFWPALRVAPTDLS